MGRLLSMDYPVESAGETICAAYEYDRAETVARWYEQYDFAKINDELVEQPELRAALAVMGYDKVDSCEAARIHRDKRLEFSERDLPQEDAEPLKDEAYLSATPPARWSTGEEQREGTGEGGSEASRLLIHNGYFWATAGSVAVTVNSGQFCTGQLIGPRELIMAAHCVPWSGSNSLFVKGGVYQTECISSASCGWSSANVYRPAGYTGDGDVDDDIAVVVMTSPWVGTGANSDNWLRLLTSAITVGTATWLTGYGAAEEDWTGIWQGRLSNGTPTVDAVASKRIRYNYAATEGNPCKGDSGGPPISTSIYPGHSISLGDFSVFTGGSVCSTGGQYWYTTFATKISWIEASIGRTCATGTSGSFQWRRCW
jgi:hypothetical protein